jgi:hypothetical protein
MLDGKKLETFLFFAVQHNTPWVSNSCAIWQIDAVRQIDVVRQISVLCKQTLKTGLRTFASLASRSTG